LNCAVDSSVAIAAILADHDAHEGASDALAQSDVTIAHVASETYSVLTRLPPPLRLDTVTAASMVRARLPATLATLDADGHKTALEALAQARVGGGATYDGLIGLTARQLDLELVSNDLRAVRAYRALGVRFRVLAQPLG
jgi:toxin FitB